MVLLIFKSTEVVPMAFGYAAKFRPRVLLVLKNKAGVGRNGAGVARKLPFASAKGDKIGMYSAKRLFICCQR